MIFASWLVVDAATRPIWEQFLGLNCDKLVAWDPPSQKESPGHGPGLSIRRSYCGSIFQKKRAAELIVDPCSQKIEILADAIGSACGRGEVHRSGLHE